MKLRHFLVLGCLFFMQPSHANTVKEAAGRAQSYLTANQGLDGVWIENLPSSNALYSLQFILTLDYLNLTNRYRSLIHSLMTYVWSTTTKDHGIPIYPNGPPHYGLSSMAYLAAIIDGESESTLRMQRLAEIIKTNHGFDHDSPTSIHFFTLLGISPEAACNVSHKRWWLYQQVEGGLPWVRAMLTPFFYLMTHGNIRPFTDRHRVTNISLPVQKCKVQEIVPLDGAEKFIRHWIATHVDSHGLLFDFSPSTMLGLMLMDQFPDLRSLELQGLSSIRTFLNVISGGGAQMSVGDASLFETSLILPSLRYSSAEGGSAYDRGLQALLHSQKVSGGFGYSYFNARNADVDSTVYAGHDLLDEYRSRPKPVLLTAIIRSANWLIQIQNDDGGFSTYEPIGDSWVHSFLNDVVEENVPGLAANSSVIEHSARVLSYVNELSQVCQNQTQALIFNSISVDFCKKIAVSGKRVFDWLSETVAKKDYVEGAWIVYSGAPTVMVARALLDYPKIKSYPLVQKTSLRLLKYSLSIQQKNGSWGESAESYDQKKSVEFAGGIPGQTGIIIRELLLMYQTQPNLRTLLQGPGARATQYLVNTQKAQGNWEVLGWTGVEAKGFDFINYPIAETGTILESLELYRQLILKENGK